MKDLYNRIGVSPEARRAVIEAKLATLPQGPDRVDAAAVLLDDMRRAVYDRHLAVVRSVAAVRAMTGLERSGFWSAAEYGDFQRSRANGSKHTTHEEAPRAQRATRHAETSSPHTKDEQSLHVGHSFKTLLASVVERVVSFLLLLGLIWLIGFVFETCSGPGEDSLDGGEYRPKSGELDFHQNR